MIQHKLSIQTVARMDAGRFVGCLPCELLSILLLFVLASAGCRKNEPTAIVHGGSMAPNFVGDHYRVQCDDCDFRFVVGLAESAHATKVVCPNCGFGDNELSRAVRHESPVMSVRPIARSLHRWEVAAFRFPGEPTTDSRLGVKRIVGLPNEVVRIADGEIWIGDQIARKSLEQQISIAIPVFDSAFVPGKIVPVPSRFRFEPENNDRQPENNVFQMQVAEHGLPIRLCYTHWAGYRQAGDRFEATAIKDDYSYNPSENRSLNSIHEILVQAMLSMSEGVVELSVDLADPKLVCVLDGQSGCIRVRCGESLNESIPWKLPKEPFELTVSNIDDQVTVAIDGAVVFLADCETRLTVDPKGRIEPVSVRLNRGEVVVSRIRIARDLYYFDFLKGGDPPTAGALNHEYVLGENEYLLLGDNVPQSSDSRSWARSGVPRSNLFGVVHAPKIQEK